ncbi:NADPH-quinone reductase (modulator of drug activity B) [Lactobacillus selangorensis]|uniref:NADPH-quinone reductase (Modulator of drug activity B) n=1 Tax=Lactobacillus selangorensis TaxID=81857 RepID=A0A0R2FUF6_9LACO|nr:NAD(P)H-dependent oxidoreductase [Lactobacillus selangorensis]KRN28395.1 NADPH-quinone reductase (modulator of drug activity B) [Lactobacillus selangorensis]KRN31896.1 NADPH-quinone reductase (modulator of drug activity B) [Lactobacillus selangorensis]
MKTVIIFDHPYTMAASNNIPHFRSYSAALAKHTQEFLEANGDSVDVIDLDADQFDPVMHQEDLTNWRMRRSISPQADDYYERINNADRLIFIFPVWWELMPAMMKGFIDKVFAKGKLVSTHPKVLLAKRPQIDVFTVAGTPTPLYKLYFRQPVVNALYRGTFKKLGMKHFKWLNFTPERQSEAKRIASLKRVDKVLQAK